MSAPPAQSHAAQSHAPSYYAASAHPSPDRPALSGAVTTGVCVIGAGFTGLSAALHLAEKGFQVTVLEANRVGWGASGRNGGQLVNGYSRDLDTIRERYGKDAERTLAAMAQEGAAIIRERVAKYGLHCDLVDGGFHAAFTAKQMRGLEGFKRTWEANGLDGLEMVDAARLPDVVKTDRYVGGMIDHVGGHMHPLNYCLGSAVAFEGLGGVIHEASPVLSIDESGPKPVVRTAQGAVTAETVLICGNAYLHGVAPKVEREFMPTSSQVLTTEPLDPALLDELLPGNHCVEDCNYVLDYYRRTADNRLLYGAGIVYGARELSDITASVRPKMLKTFPGLKTAKIDFAWSGDFALTLTRVPHIGRLSPTVWFSHGDSGHGVTTTQLLGRLLAEGLSGQMERFDAWAALPCLPFPGGRTLSVPLSALGAWYYGLRDKLGI
jgi:gamma-glutamylputrescine oxidase